MQGKKGLVVVLAVLVAVIAVAALAYNMLAPGASALPEIAQSAPGENSESATSEGTAESRSENVVENTATPSTGNTNAGEADTDIATAASSLPNFSVQDRQGNTVELASMQGKPTFVCFWATWCPPCNAEAPHIQSLYETYGESINILMIDVTDGDRDTPEVVEEWIVENGYTYPIYLDTTMEASNACQVYYLPTSFVLDSQGNILASFSGAISEEDGKNLFEQMLEY